MASTRKKFAFWSTQPVTKLDEQVTTNECIEPNKEVSEIRAEPYTLPGGFKWVTLDLTDAESYIFVILFSIITKSLELCIMPL